MKAKFVEKWFDTVNKKFVLVYEYRGCKYEVIDHSWNGGEPLSWQHNNEQARIDDMLDRKTNENFIAEDAQVGFDLFWEYVNS